ncbi:MAG: acetate--CoA ligase family protein [Verrucomicrobia bacterium]|nr:acetate--CoA ligase family protein [Verrucomicrobiota bacterium]
METTSSQSGQAAANEAHASPKALAALFTPQSIAIIGATEKEGAVGRTVVENLQIIQFHGPIYPVNPKRDTILGLKAYPSIGAIGQPVDVAVIITPPKTVPSVMSECVNARVKFAIVISAGFKEAGPAGLELEQQVVNEARRGGVRFIGPNCLGVVNMHANVNASFAPSIPPAGKISVISQSGALCVAILDWATSCGLGLSKVVSFGNKADLNEVDFLRAFAEDPDTNVVAAYLESITEGDRFLEVAEEIASVKPVVVLKVGVTQAGAKAASSHTGSLAGADMAYWAAFKRSGVIRAEDFEALFDYALAFATQPLPKGNRLAIVTNAGGPGIMAADAAELSGLRLLPPKDSTRDKLRQVLPPTAATGNPIDVIGDAEPDRYINTLKLIQDDENIDGILVVVTPQNMTAPLELAKQLHATHNRKRPLLTAFMGGKEIIQAKDFLMQVGIPNYPSPTRAVAAFKAMSDYAAWRVRPPRVVTRFPVNRRRVDRVIQWQMRSDIQQVGEVEAKEILRAYDFNVLDGFLARTPGEAVDAAERIGYPVVLKISSPDIIHKSDFGGVRINLANAEQVRDAFDLMMLRVQRRAPKAFIRGAFVEKMGSKGREVILGMTRDPQFGPMLMFGLGGIFVEVMKDVTFYLAPITATEAMQMLKGTRSYALLQGARGQAPVDLDAIASALQRISQLATDYPQIMELDINPFIVGEVGTEAYVADARMTLAKLHA